MDDKLNIRRGDIFYADLRPVVGSEQGGVRPVLIIQNNIGNKHSHTVIVACVTSKIDKAKLPTHVYTNSGCKGLHKMSCVMLEQVRTIDKSRLKERVWHLNDDAMKAVSSKLAISLGMG